jgi:hypothetical protein
MSIAPHRRGDAIRQPDVATSQVTAKRQSRVLVSILEATEEGSSLLVGREQ